MQPLTKVMQGATCTVKWALGLPETVEKLRELKIEQGSKLQVVCKNSDYMIIGVGSKRYAVGNEIAVRTRKSPYNLIFSFLFCLYLHHKSILVLFRISPAC